MGYGSRTENIDILAKALKQLILATRFRIYSIVTVGATGRSPLQLIRRDHRYSFATHSP